MLKTRDGLRLPGHRLVVRVEQRRSAAAKRIGAVEVRGELLVFVIEHQLRAEFQSMSLGGEDRIVIGLDVQLVQSLRPDVRAATGERTRDLQLRRSGVRRIVLAVPAQRNAGLVHQVHVGRGHIGEAQHVLVRVAVISGLGQICAAHTDVLQAVYIGAVGCNERILRAKLPIQPGFADPEPLRRRDVRNRADFIAGVVEGDCVHDPIVVDRAVFQIEGEVRTLLAHGAGQLEAVALLADRRLAHRKRITRVLPRAAIGGKQRAMKSTLAGLGVNLHAPAVEGRFAILGGEQIRVHFDIRNGALRWQLA